MAGVQQPGASDAGGSRPPSAIAVPPRADLILMPIAILAVSTSGPLMAAAAAPALAVALWRNLLAAAVIGPYALARHRAELAAMSARERKWTVCAGVLLALHFMTWTPSLRFTSVASATAIVCSQPIWVALIARASGHDVPRRAWWGIALALVSVVVLTGVDFSLEPRALVGDLLALLGGMFSAAYTVAGAEVRRTVSTTSYTLLCYSTSALLLLVVCVVGRVQITGFSSTTWLQLLALTFGAQLLGHSLINRVLRTTSPTVVSLALLFEVVGAAVIAAIYLGQTPPLEAIPAAVLLLAGIAIVISARPRGVEPTVAAD
jgi:drug/metabolite transporter (DMT)-like permease